MQNIFDMIKNMDKNQLNEGIRQAQAYMQSEEGKKTVERLKKGESIENVLSSVSGNDNGKNQVLKELSNNPQILALLSQYINKK